jgi:hypothetical protein
MEFASAIIGFGELLLMGAAALADRANPVLLVGRRAARQVEFSCDP